MKKLGCLVVVSILIVLVTGLLTQICSAQDDSPKEEAEGRDTSAQLSDLHRTAIEMGVIRVELEPAEPSDSDRGVPWSPRGTQVKLESVEGWLVGKLKVGERMSMPVRFQSDAKQGIFAFDTNLDRKFSAEETFEVAGTDRRGKIWYSQKLTLKLGDSEFNRSYPMSVWYVDDPSAPDAKPIMRWSRRGWHEGAFELDGETRHLLITDGNSDGGFGSSDSWGLGSTRQEMFEMQNCTAKIGGHAWLGDIPFSVVECDPEGMSITIRAFDLGMTRAEETSAKDPYREDKAFARAAEPVVFLHDFDEAVTQAKAKEQMILVDFETEWCGPCKTMDKLVYTAEPIVDRAKSFVMVKLDGDKEKELVKKYKVEAYPTLVLLKSDGTEIRRVRGYQSVKRLLAFLAAKGE